MARIKQILAMDIGKDAVDSWSKCEKALFTLPGEAGGGRAATPAADRRAAAMPPCRPAACGRPATSSGVSPLAGRYVDDKGKPLADPTQQPYGEFRMMPINLKVVIEQKEIPRLLAECANSAMRIDVRRVRILVEEPPPVDLPRRMRLQAAPPRPKQPRLRQLRRQPPLRPDRPRRGRRLIAWRIRRSWVPDGGGNPGAMESEASGRGASSPTSEESADPVYPPVPVEVQGIIYIYNPPPGLKSGRDGRRQWRSSHARRTPNDGTPVNGTGRNECRRAGLAQALISSPPATPRQLPPAAAGAPTNSSNSANQHAGQWRSSMKSKTKFDPKVIQQFCHRPHGEIRDWAGRRFVSLLRLPVLRGRGRRIQEEAGRTQDGHGRRLGQDRQ